MGKEAEELGGLKGQTGLFSNKLQVGYQKSFLLQRD